jgi:hypothetical protein
VVLPELLGRVLAGHALEDLCAAGVVVEEGCGLRRLAAAHWTNLPISGASRS